MIQAVIFDVGGVLIDYDQRADQRYVQDALGVDDTIVTAIWKDLMAMMGRENVGETDFWRHIIHTYSVSDPSKTNDLLYRSFKQAITPRPAMLDYAARLRARGLRTAIISNINEPHANALRDIGIFDDFESVVLSYAVGVRKPDAKIYHHTLELLGVTADKALFIDDLPECIQGAKEVGLHTILAKNTPQIIHAIDKSLEITI